MNDPHSFFHIWGYVIISYGLVCLCSALLGVSTYIRFKRSRERLRLIELALKNQSLDDRSSDDLQLLHHNEVS
ncbi:hypothetical protein PT277_02470 [Acetobacteraceae bacterium ESL0709]|nr:hypothetical protein [Acetobacteraceae bacterium ESL0697]MDF7677567.1 hypothetical protein [Acetobacteraceae bacterium ESL0709]